MEPKEAIVALQKAWAAILAGACIGCALVGWFVYWLTI